MKRLHQPFEWVSKRQPSGDQPSAIAELLDGFKRDQRRQTLLGVTGSGKTFTMAKVIAALNVPTLVMAHNKTLAAQLYEEFRQLFPHNAVEYFVSYYDYYQPEAYVASSDTYIAKDSTINDAIDRMRHSATQTLFERDDVIIISSVSCIYGLGSAESYSNLQVALTVGDSIDRDAVIKQLTAIQFERNDVDFHRGTFRVRGDVLEVFPAAEEDRAVRIEWFGDDIEAITWIDPLRGRKLEDAQDVALFPATHYAVAAETRQRALGAIRTELDQHLGNLRQQQHLVEAQRLEQRTMFDLEMLEHMGYCNGIENYSRHLTGRNPGEPPPTLLDYFPKDFLLLIDESHQTVPQIRAMYKGDRSRKENLVRYGFRLPSAMDNRPLRFEEFMDRVGKAIYVSATPGDFELEQSQGVVVEQVIRPTGLIDPPVEMRPVTNQVDDLLDAIADTIEAGYRVLVTTLTKRMAEDLTEFYAESGVRVRYMHSDIDTLERVALIRDLRLGKYDVLVGINLLREGLDLPEVGLVAILDADKESFLRSSRSLIQTIGRAARNVDGRVILYADQMTDAIRTAITETDRRRGLQKAYNKAHNITPESVHRPVHDALSELEARLGGSDDETPDTASKRRTRRGGKSQPRSRTSSQTPTTADTAGGQSQTPDLPVGELPKLIADLRKQMATHAEALEFEQAAELRDRIHELERLHLELS